MFLFSIVFVFVLFNDAEGLEIVEFIFCPSIPLYKDIPFIILKI